MWGSKKEENHMTKLRKLSAIAQRFFWCFIANFEPIGVTRSLHW